VVFITGFSAVKCYFIPCIQKKPWYFYRCGD